MQRLREDKTDRGARSFEKATEVDAEFGEAYYQLFETNYILYERCGDQKAKIRPPDTGRKPSP